MDFQLWSVFLLLVLGLWERRIVEAAWSRFALLNPGEKPGEGFGSIIFSVALTFFGFELWSRGGREVESSDLVSGNVLERKKIRGSRL